MKDETFKSQPQGSSTLLIENTLCSSKNISALKCMKANGIVIAKVSDR